MRCVAFCTADSYKLGALGAFFRNKGYGIRHYRKVLHAYDLSGMKEIFAFGYGCIVTWGFSRSEEQQILKDLETYSTKLLPQIEKDFFVYRRGEKTEITTYERFNADIITLESDSSQIKLAISYGLAQSIQLESYETLVQKIIDKDTPLFDELAKTGKISLSRRAIPRRMGEIFYARSLINLNSEYLEAPEYFWEHPSVENYYGMSEKFLDISRRVTTLNQKLSVLHELFELLTMQLQHWHSSFLEIIIIVLIFIEIVISLVLVH